MLPDLYCCSCGKQVRCVVNDHMHLVPERAFAVCEGPFAFCPPPDEGAFSIPDEPDEVEEDETEYDFYSAHRFDPIP